jgi:hypothetical protein
VSIQFRGTGKTEAINVMAMPETTPVEDSDIIEAGATETTQPTSIEILPNAVMPSDTNDATPDSAFDDGLFDAE